MLSFPFSLSRCRVRCCHKNIHLFLSLSLHTPFPNISNFRSVSFLLLTFLSVTSVSTTDTHLLNTWPGAGKHAHTHYRATLVFTAQLRYSSLLSNQRINDSHGNVNNRVRRKKNRANSGSYRDAWRARKKGEQPNKHLIKYMKEDIMIFYKI